MVSGVLDAFSAGVLIYTGLVEVRGFLLFLVCVFVLSLFFVVVVVVFVFVIVDLP